MLTKEGCAVAASGCGSGSARKSNGCWSPTRGTSIISAISGCIRSAFRRASGLLLLERDKGATLLCDNLTVESTANEPHVDRKVVETWYDHTHSAGNRDHALVEGAQAGCQALWPDVPVWSRGNRCRFAATEVLPLADVRIVPVHRPVESWEQKSAGSDGRRRRTRSYSQVSACGPPTRVMRGRGIFSCAGESPKWTCFAKSKRQLWRRRPGRG